MMYFHLLGGTLQPGLAEAEEAKRKTPMLKKFLVALALVLVVFIAVAASWLSYARAPLADALEALVSDDSVLVSESPWLSFTPAGSRADTGVILYPGGRIDPRGFAPLARAIAAEGYLVVVPTMRLNIAALSPDRASEAIATWPDIHRWVLAGHSIGGVMAAKYAHDHPKQITGLVIWAAYPDNNTDLSGRELPVTVIYASEDDALAQPARVEARRHLLPAHTRWVLIEGGDHHQFGSYEVTGPRSALISAADQQQQIITATLALLAELPAR